MLGRRERQFGREQQPSREHFGREQSGRYEQRDRRPRENLDQAGAAAHGWPLR